MRLGYPQNESLPEVWGGLECTVNRVGDQYFDQIRSSGHHERLDDLDRFAWLGIRRLRYPVLWERVAPDGLASANWAWADERLARIRALGMEPIIGLLHHGSGPRYTSLLDSEFPGKFAQYAGEVARRFPWVRFYTPVNEPLTTARFSCLYGHWYPHERNPFSFARAVLNQCRATVLGMQAIREVNSEAQLIQTEDLGKTHSTAALAYQADHENQRRWSALDLLCGTMSAGTPMHSFFRDVGVGEDELAWFQQNACPPDILGFNYYLTSERFLDHRTHLYPPHMVGSNGRHRYADLEAVRVRRQGIDGAALLLKEAWQRFGRPLAITEVHNGCTREEQLRWMQEIWRDACELRASGVDFIAMTVWALLGSSDWNSLVTVCNGHYEPGAFDVRAPQPRLTAVARMTRAYAHAKPFHSPVLATEGWWRKEARLLFDPVDQGAHARQGGSKTVRPVRPQPVLITGASGTLGQAFARICEIRGIAYILTSRRDLDIADGASVRSAIDRYCPWAIINTAGYVRVDEAERDLRRCMQENADGAYNLAEGASQQGIQLVTFSSDLVFDGNKPGPYVEHDPACPLNTYGFSKAEAERRVLAAMPGALVVRTSAFFGPWDTANFLFSLIRCIQDGNPFQADGELRVSPTYVPDLVHATLDLLLDGECGLIHLANAGMATWAEFGCMAAIAFRQNPDLVRPCPARDMRYIAPRPRQSALTSARRWIMPTLQNAIDRFARECELLARVPLQNVA